MNITFENFTKEMETKLKEEFNRIYTIYSIDYKTPFPPITIVWNERMRTRAGTANWKTNTVILNAKLLTENSEQLLQVFVHEICHLLTHHHYEKWKVPTKPHGRQWKQMMCVFGYEPDRTHCMDVSHLKHNRKMYSAWCACTEHKVGEKRKNKILDGSVYRCRICKEKLELDENDL